MRIKTPIEFERESGTVRTEIQGDVSKHFGILEVADFECELELTADERELAEEKLTDIAREEASPFGFPEMEPDAKRYSR